MINAQYADKTNNEYQRIDLVALTGKFYAKGQYLTKLQDALKDNIKLTGMITSNSDHEIRMSSGMAWVTFSQITTKADTMINKKREM